MSVQMYNFDLMQYRFTKHVLQSFQTAMILSDGHPISANNALFAVIHVHHMYAERKQNSSESFSKLASLLRVSPTKLSLTDLDRLANIKDVPINEYLLEAYNIAKIFWNGSDTVWGRDFITATLLAKDPSIYEFGIANIRQEYLQDEWFKFVTSSKEQRNPSMWVNWWHSADVPTPDERNRTQSVSDNSILKASQLKKIEMATLNSVASKMPKKDKKRRNESTSSKKTYLLTWDPSRFMFESIKDHADKVKFDGSSIMSWNVGKNGIKLDDRVFFMRHGDIPGLVGSGHVVSDVRIGPHWDRTRPNNWQTAYADVKWDRLEEIPIISLNDLTALGGEIDIWTKRGSGHLIPEEIAVQLEQLWSLSKDSSNTVSQQNSPVSSASSELGPTRVEDIATVDRLGRGTLTNALVRLLTVRDDARPYAIGLFGHWGSGKSSQIAQVKDALQRLNADPIIRVVEFNAWSHERANNVAAALAQSVVDALVEKLSFFDQIRLAAKLAQKRRIKVAKSIERDRLRFLHLFIETWSIWSPIFLFLCVFGYFAMNSKLWHAILVGLTAIPAVITTYLGGTHFVGKNLTGWFKKFNFTKHIDKLRLPDYSIHLGLYHDIRKNLDILCTLQLRQDDDPQKGDYLLVVIDDLDRCGPEMVKQVFDAVRLVAHIPRVVTLVSIDERMAFCAVEQHYSKLGHAGREPALVARDYLAKVFQVAINLPAPDDPHVREFITTKLFTEIIDEPLLEEIASTTANNNSDLPKESNLPSSNSEQPLENPGHENQLTESFASTAQVQNRTVLGEKGLFADLAIAYSFSNPRLLWRLMQSWRLLKSIVLLGRYNLAEAEPWLRMLFWREWLFQQDSQIRLKCQDWPITNQFEIIPSNIREAMPKESLQDDYLKRCINIESVLLPAAPANVLQDNSAEQSTDAISSAAAQRP